MKKIFVFTFNQVSSLKLKLLAFFVFMPIVASAQVFGGKAQTDTNLLSGAETTAYSNQAEPEEVPDIKTDNIQVKPVSTKAESLSSEERNKPKIRLYMRNFSIYKDLSGILNCSVQFYVRSTMPERISNISYRLKWPNMETPVSYDDVEPGTLVYSSHSLLGKGCYSMDQVPNIIVNRCRIKGMSQQECANAIVWEE